MTTNKINIQEFDLILRHLGFLGFEFHELRNTNKEFSYSLPEYAPIKAFYLLRESDHCPDWEIYITRSTDPSRFPKHFSDPVTVRAYCGGILQRTDHHASLQNAIFRNCYGYNIETDNPWLNQIGRYA